MVVPLAHELWKKILREFGKSLGLVMKTILTRAAVECKSSKAFIASREIYLKSSKTIY